jgi:DNA-binding protein WhiA
MTADGILHFQTENYAVVRKYFTLLTKTFNIDTAIAIRESCQMKKGKVYFVEIADPAQIETVLQGTKLSVDKCSGETLYAGNGLVIQQSCCKRAFIRGAFLASGSISDPEKGYHFEIVCDHAEQADMLARLIRDFSIEPKQIQRKKYYVVYIKDGSMIVDLLNIMGAHVSLMDMENIRILKDMRNSVNRRVNCETANLNKVVSAAVKQMEDITYIEQTKGLKYLPERLREIASLRMEEPDTSLVELGKKLNPPLGKSGVNHRLKKISDIANELRRNQNDQ